MNNCGGVPLRGWFSRADERSLGGTRWKPIGPFLTIILGLLWFLPPAFAESQGAYPSPESLCLRVSQEQRQRCIAQNRASSQAYQQSLEQYRRQPRGAEYFNRSPIRRQTVPSTVSPSEAAPPQGTPAWYGYMARPSRERALQDMARSRQQAEEYRLKREQEREAQRLEREQKAAERRKLTEEREAARRRERALEREQREQQRQEELAQHREQARVLAVQRQQEQARQAEQYRQLQVEAAERVAEERAEGFREADVLLRKLSWGMVAMVVVLALLPAYRLYAPNRLMAFRQWDYHGRLIISSIALGIFFWLFAVDPAESAGTAYLAALLGVIGLPAVFFLPGAFLLLLQFLHYLAVPHPAEAYIDQARQSGDLNLDAAKGAAESMYDPRRDGVFAEWRSNNRQRRLAAEADLLRRENEAMEELIRNQKVKARQSFQQETDDGRA